MNAALKNIVLGMGCALALIAGLWLGGFGMFLYEINRYEVPPPIMRTDAIVVLTGGADRINTGLDLLQSGSAGRLLISGVDERVSVEKILSMWNGHLDDPGCCVFLGHMAQNTEQNAEETKQWADQMYVRSIRLVTSAYHMPRALMEFRHAMPNVTILPHPVSAGPEFSPAYIALAAHEYDKSILRKTRLHIKESNEN